MLVSALVTFFTDPVPLRSYRFCYDKQDCLMINLTRNYKKFKPFTDSEAWTLFKIAAIGEACGWTLLISGILCQRYLLPHSKIPVLVTGQIHGTFFLIYMAAAVVLSPSLGWSLRRAVIAVLCGVPPYGSLIFELWTSNERQKRELINLSYFLYYRYLITA
jgi:integral membrane protein